MTPTATPGPAAVMRPSAVSPPLSPFTYSYSYPGPCCRHAAECSKFVAPNLQPFWGMSPNTPSRSP